MTMRNVVSITNPNHAVCFVLTWYIVLNTSQSTHLSKILQPQLKSSKINHKVLAHPLDDAGFAAMVAHLLVVP